MTQQWRYLLLIISKHIFWVGLRRFLGDFDESNLSNRKHLISSGFCVPMRQPISARDGCLSLSGSEMSGPCMRSACQAGYQNTASGSVDLTVYFFIDVCVRVDPSSKEMQSLPGQRGNLITSSTQLAPQKDAILMQWKTVRCGVLDNSLQGK